MFFAGRCRLQSTSHNPNGSVPRDSPTTATDLPLANLARGRGGRDLPKKVNGKKTSGGCEILVNKPGSSFKG